MHLANEHQIDAALPLTFQSVLHRAEVIGNFAHVGDILFYRFGVLEEDEIG